MLKPVVSALILWLFAYTSLSVQAIPQSTQDSAQSANGQDSSQGEGSPLIQLGSKYHNGIELLQNRFRIDYEVDDITMIFFRKFGSAPIVLVRPDGSKIFQSNADGENIFWFDSATYDMINIKNPTPGPWQAVGQITPESRVMVISDLALHADPLPAMIFSGEILKQSAYLTNNNIPIDYTAFRDVVELTISLSSTNNPNYNNFGANTEVVAIFEDNGKGMDERPLDGVFTGQFNLAIADGEWIPTFSVSTPMFTREQVDPNIMLLANPIKVDIELDGGGDGYHKLKVDAQREYVDMSTLLLDGKVRFPNGDIQNFSITDMSADVREYLIVNYEYGVYRVKLTAYGNTTDGREFILDVPEYSFLTEEPDPVIEAIAPGMGDPTMLDGSEQQNILAKTPDAPENVGMSTSMLVSLIVTINLFLLIVGGGLIWWLTLDKKPDFKFTRKKKAPLDKKELVKKEGMFAKIFKSKEKEQPKENKPQTKEQSDPGFMDLGIPKD
ncbi:TIGR03503 family protein [uncultured Paraglaciecola sp.]|uniref:TIGR03503 family protein n=1 Tax=uncultured Paraglaciecola sp. TaxID=1765024 RepID=UPI0030D7FFE4|tara:strand:- start:334453 stop:335946 length:1494 start_codon:yes stop_codon:yes gene_type:complete